MHHTYTHLEPVNGAAVNEGREASQAVPESVSDGTHGQHHMQLSATALDKHVEEGQGAAVRLLVPVTLAVQRSHSLADFLLLINCKQVRHLERTKTEQNRIHHSLHPYVHPSFQNVPHPCLLLSKSYLLQLSCVLPPPPPPTLPHQC